MTTKIKFKVGDHVICTCGYNVCNKYFIVYRIDDTGRIYCNHKNGSSNFSSEEVKKYLKLDPIEETKLAKVLR